MTQFTEQPNAIIRSAIAQSKKIDAIVIAQDALRRVPALLREHFKTSSVFLIADENTMAAAGDAPASADANTQVAEAAVKPKAGVKPKNERNMPKKVRKRAAHVEKLNISEDITPA